MNREEFDGAGNLPGIRIGRSISIRLRNRLCLGLFENMHATELLKSVPQEPASVIALVGDELALKTAVTNALLKVALPNEDDAPTRYSGKDIDMKSVRDELLTISMWGDRRVVVIDDASDFVTANRPALEKYAEKPAKKSVLILDVKTLAKNTRLYKIINKSGLVAECSELKGAALVNWVQDAAQRSYGKKIDRDAVQLLIELAGSALGLLDQELSKLASYVGDQPSIDAQAVRRLVGGWKAETTWAMTDAVRDGRLGDALTALDKLLNSGESPHRILGGIGYVFRKMSVATELSRTGVQLNAALKQAGAFPNELDPPGRYLKRIGRPKAAKIASWLLEAETGLKGGSRLPERSQIELLMVRLAGAV
ncbi:MAG: DNA polymerase III subunit delta [Planctomycetota bacterium]|nr:DNA polymerase III subunit delta [Planctomycetota bacterium]